MSLLKAYLTPHPPIIIEEIGGSEASICQDTIDNMKMISKEIADLKPDNIIIISPHAPMFRDAVTIIGNNKLNGNFGQFGYPSLEMTLENNAKFAKEVYMATEERNLPAVLLDESSSGYDFRLDHGIMVPLYFIIEQYSDFKLIPMNYGLINRKSLSDFGALIYDEIEKSKESFIIIASGDLSHSLLDRGPYSFTEEGPKFDMFITNAIDSSDLASISELNYSFVENAHQCGYNSLLILSGALSRTDYKSKVLSYEGPFGVGYAVAEFETANNAQRSNHYVDLATKAVEYYVKNSRALPVPDNTPDELLENRSGVFVTLYKDGQLRGCIGTIEPVQENIAYEIINNAISACSRDPRFYPVDVSELYDLEISVDVLHEAEKIDSFDKLDTKKYGVIVRSGMRSGLLLPNIDGVDTVEYQVQIALNKAGISPAEDYTLERFEVVRHK